MLWKENCIYKTSSYTIQITHHITYSHLLKSVTVSYQQVDIIISEVIFIRLLPTVWGLYLDMAVHIYQIRKCCFSWERGYIVQLVSRCGLKCPYKHESWTQKACLWMKASYQIFINMSFLIHKSNINRCMSIVITDTYVSVIVT